MEEQKATLADEHPAISESVLAGLGTEIARLAELDPAETAAPAARIADILGRALEEDDH
jgi:hypothetical protein